MNDRRKAHTVKCMHVCVRRPGFSVGGVVGVLSFILSFPSFALGPSIDRNNTCLVLERTMRNYYANPNHRRFDQTRAAVDLPPLLSGVV
jgi:hypothetical protein